MRKRVLAVVLMVGVLACACTKNNVSENNTSEDTQVAQTEATVETEQTSVSQETIVDAKLIPEEGSIDVDDKALSVGIDPEEEGLDYGNLYVQYGEEKLSLDYADYLTNKSAVIIKDNGDLLILAVGGGCNDWYITYFVKYSETGGLEKIDKMSGSINDISDIDGDTAKFYSRADVLGTFGYYRYIGLTAAVPSETKEGMCYIINERFSDEPDYYEAYDYDEEFLKTVMNTYDPYGRRILTVKTPFKIYDADDNAKELQIGETIYPTAFDEDKKIYYCEYNDQAYHFSYDCTDGNEYDITIDGVSQNELFLDFIYAG